MNDSNDNFLDARGLYCPEPIMMLHKAFRNMDVGDELEMRATDPSTERDIIKFCQFLGHELLHNSNEDGEWTFRLKKNRHADQ